MQDQCPGLAGAQERRRGKQSAVPSV